METPPKSVDDVCDSLEQALARRRSTILELNRVRVDPILDFARSVARGLDRNPPQIECRFLYDERGSALYEEITCQPEYYPTRTEAGILSRSAGRIFELTGPVTLIELGSGSSTKTGHLLDACESGSRKCRYVPIDVSGSALRQASRMVAEDHPRTLFVGIHGTYEDAFPLLKTTSPAMVVFLGSTIGNFDEGESNRFLNRLAEALGPDDFVLLGIDLVKEHRLLEAAYNDAAGVTAAFTRNLFERMNRELGCCIDVSEVEHLARYNEALERIEIDALFGTEQAIHLPALNRSFLLPAGTRVRTEISRKFRLESYLPYLETFGLSACEVFTDDRYWFALLLLQKSKRTSPS